MSKFYGKVGYAISIEKTDSDGEGIGVFIDEIIEKPYYGDTIKLSSKWQKGLSVNDDLEINYQISILADPFAYENFSRIKYVEFMGYKWKVTTIDPARPRITFTIGGLYNEET